MASRRPRSDLALRAVTAVVGIPLVLLAVYLGGPVFAGLVALVAAVATLEYARMVRSGGYRPALVLLLPVAIALAIAPQRYHQVQAIWVGIMVLGLFLTGAYYLLPPFFARGLPNAAVTTLGMLYCGLLPGHLVLLRSGTNGARWLLLVVLVTWAYDTGAYFTGRSIGRHPFMSHISAKKTVEGVVGGVLVSGLAGLLSVPLVHLSWPVGFAFGALAGIVAQIGDLIESMIKRQVGVKDSGTIVPGHGGLLDRIDSLLFTGTLGVYAAALLSHAS